MNEQLVVATELPHGFYDFEPDQILEYFPQPTLVRLEGRNSPALFVSILLHGNEFSGLKSVQDLLRKYGEDLPRAIYLFVGNVTAAAQGNRVIPGQVDHNRCWPGTEMADCEETRLMQAVVDRVSRAPLFAAIDIHNNSGFNPHYAGITKVTQENQHLAAMFNHIALVFKRPRGVSSMSFEDFCPAITLECGLPGEPTGIHHATEMLDALLHLDHIPQRPVPAHDLQLVRTIATLNIPDHVSFDFNLSDQVDLSFEQDFDHLNFTEIQSHDVFAHTRIAKPLSITDQQGEDVTDQIIRVERGKVYLNNTFMPAMISMDEAIVRQDCLCHLLVDYHV